jgi:hypothetical protein
MGAFNGGANVDPLRFAQFGAVVVDAAAVGAAGTGALVEQLEQVTGQHSFISWAHAAFLEVQRCAPLVQVHPSHPSFAAMQLSLSEHAGVVGVVGLGVEKHENILQS